MNHNQILGRIIPDAFHNTFQNVMNELLDQTTPLSGDTNTCNDTANIANSTE